jgi:hypothetical protein
MGDGLCLTVVQKVTNCQSMLESDFTGAAPVPRRRSVGTPTDTQPTAKHRGLFIDQITPRTPANNKNIRSIDG